MALLVAGCVSRIEMPAEEADQTAKETIFVEGVANVLFSEELAEMLESGEGTIATKSPSLNEAFEAIGVTSYTRLFPHAGEYEQRTRDAGLHRWYRITYKETTAVTKAQQSFSDILQPAAVRSLFWAELRLDIHPISHCACFRNCQPDLSCPCGTKKLPRYFVRQLYGPQGLYPEYHCTVSDPGIDAGQYDQHHRFCQLHPAG